MSTRGDDRQVVDPGDLEVDVAEVGVEEQREEELEDRDLVAQPDVLIGVSRVTARQSVVIGLVMLSIHASGQTLLHVAGDVEEHRDVAQRAADAAGTDGVADALRDAVPARDLEVVAHADAKPPVEIVTTT